MKIWGITDRGNVRAQNQDAFYHWTDGKAAFGVVCDGMGGALSGNVASALAAQNFVECVSGLNGDPSMRMRAGLIAANQVVHHRGLNDPACKGMGTTLVAAFARDGERAYVLNVGDSRCYYLAGSGIRQITRDHSLVEELVQMGHITREEARVHPHKNIITRALGTDLRVEGDLFEVELAPGNLLLLCSDGLSNELSDQQILDICAAEPSHLRCQALLEQAKAVGAHDNVTIVILEAE